MKIIPYFTSVFVLALAACGVQTSHTQWGNYDAASFSKLIDSLPNEQIVDVRTAEEFNGGHISNAQNFDWNSADFKTATISLDKNKPVLVYCLSGGRSSEAAAWFKKNGYAVVYELDGGIRTWNSAGLPVETNNNINTNTQQATGAVTTASYANTIKANPVVLVDVGATWCGPCKKLAPLLDELVAEKPGTFVLLKVDADRDRAVADSMNVDALPTLLLYKNGNLVWRSVGLVDKSVVADAIENK
jgi:thioredoxin 1